MFLMEKNYRIVLTLLLGAAVFLFWLLCYPQALSYQEQNQLFLFTWDYLGERLSLPGGLADYLSEFLVQFFYYSWGGALVMALLAILLQRSLWWAARSAGRAGERSAYILTFIPSLLMLVYMGDVEVLVSFPSALLLSIALCPLFTRAGWHLLWLIPLGWWLTGAVIAVPVLVTVLTHWRSIREWGFLLYTALVFQAGHRLLSPQYPPKEAWFGINYYRLVETLPALQVVIPLVCVFCILVCGYGLRVRRPVLAGLLTTLVLAAGTFAGVRTTYDRDTFETLAYDYLIRHERYTDVLKRAQKYQPRNQVSACSVNFCLFMNGQLLSRMDDFYQCGTAGLVLPSIRDNLSDITSARLLWMMGMPNITLQYYFDLQESIQNGRKSGRFLSGMADCNIANGWYGPAEKYLDLLAHSLFYRRWAMEKKALIRNDALVSADPVYGYIRQVRFRDDFITVYDGLDLMMGILYNQNKNNFMAAEYYTAWQRLKKKEVQP